MLVLLIRAALTGIFGSAFGKWFLSTRMGRWFQTKLDTFMEYLAKKYDIKIAKKEIVWAQQYPNLANRIEALEEQAEKWIQQYPLLAERIKRLEEFSHPPVVAGGTTEIMAELKAVQAEVEKLTPKKSSYSAKRQAK